MVTPVSPARSIFVGLDGSERSTSALVWALDDADRSRTALTLVSEPRRTSLGTDPLSPEGRTGAWSASPAVPGLLEIHPTRQQRG